MTSYPSIDVDEIVRTYANFDHHRTGTDEDRETCQWLTNWFNKLGLQTTGIDYEFPRFEADWQCRVAGNLVESIPLFYSATGDFEFENLEVFPLKLDDWEESKTLDQISTLATRQKSRGDNLLILATEAANGAVYAINVGTDLALDFPVLLVGSDSISADTRVSARVSARVSGHLKAKLAKGYSSNVIAKNLPQHKTDLIITTPFSGWYSCAAERAAGIAVMLALITRLQSRFSLQVVATSGHELHHLGTEAVQQSLHIDPTIPVLHIGSCVGVAESDLVFSSSFDQISCENQTALLKGIGAQFIQRNNQSSNAWPGESQNWVNGSRSLMSLVGVDRNFHTPLDRAGNVNTAPLSNIVEVLQAAIKLCIHPLI